MEVNVIGCAGWLLCVTVVCGNRDGIVTACFRGIAVVGAVRLCVVVADFVAVCGAGAGSVCGDADVGLVAVVADGGMASPPASHFGYVFVG